ncbi:3-hydroxy-9,10-secoandrosta-1,3,5(10)-triene-9,17-dione monooxygenase oxygenase subunit [Rhodococcus sp. NPDC127528]|uniref:3-hydroxy-9,10-secoandrosta-1,3,5(10)-triene-9, 17-dione monooxygenase oxygenase subunit n=1 Tax=unclassified Rhodococcus (in: high G+C Gram-positive bacteria) TaxID=192944 RepID=UPI00363D39B6
MTEQVLDGIRDVLPALRERAQEAEDNRRVPDESIKEIRETGFFRLLQPARYGGMESDLAPFYSAVKLIAGACGSTGWVSSVLGAHNWHLATFPEQAQDDMWAENPDTLISSAYAPMGRATATEGGYRLSGTWSFSSGSAYAGGAILGTLILGADGKAVDNVAMLVPAEDYIIEDVWHTVGLRGTGSNNIVVEDVFVPEHRVLSFADSFRCECPGQSVNTDPLYRVPLFSLMSTTIATPLVGMASGAYEAHVEHQKGRVRAYGGEKSKDDPFAKVRVAQAASEIDAAWLQLTTNISDIAAAARTGAVPMALRTKVRRDQVRASERAIYAIDRLFENSGASAISTGTPIQRFWRDAHSARVHVVNDPEAALKMFGDQEFGATIDGGML